MADLPPGLVEALSGVRTIGVITGAGLSAESGIRTYRGRGGVYDDPEEGERTVEALSGHTFARDPERTWRAIHSLLEMAWSARPNDGHRAIVRMERAASRLTLLTQNVDGLHHAAGSRDVIDIHGDVRETVCTGCGRHGRIASPDDARGLPRCRICNAHLRPDVVLFGEWLPSAKVARLRRAFHDEVPDLVLVAGTTAVFPYVQEPVFLARAAGKLTVEVNPEPTELSSAVHFALRGRAGDLLPGIASVIES
jgi:NAD-dependent deacetylase